MKMLREIVSNQKNPVNIGLFGYAKHGKSSLVGSLQAVARDAYKASGKAPVGEGDLPKSTSWIAYKIAENVIIYDNRGITDFSPEVASTMAIQLQGTSNTEVNYTKETPAPGYLSWLAGVPAQALAIVTNWYNYSSKDKITVPVVIWKGDAKQNAKTALMPILDEVKKFMPKNCEPVVVVTHKDKLANPAPDFENILGHDGDHLYLVTNYPKAAVWESKRNPENDLVLLRLLAFCIDYSAQHSKVN